MLKQLERELERLIAVKTGSLDPAWAAKEEKKTALRHRLERIEATKAAAAAAQELRNQKTMERALEPPKVNTKLKKVMTRSRVNVKEKVDVNALTVEQIEEMKFMM